MCSQKGGENEEDDFMKRVLASFLAVSFLIVGSVSAVAVSEKSHSQIMPDAKKITSGRKVFVEAKEFKFAPISLNLKKGERVVLTFKNNGKLPHTFSVPDLNIETGIIMSGKNRTIAFEVPSTAGSFRAVCKIPGHDQAGMIGKVIIK